MSVVQVFLGRPRCLLPSIFPSISCSCVELCRIRCPRYCNFLVLNCLTISLSVPILLITSSLVIFSVCFLVLPVLYGSELWGYEDLLQIEVIHRKFLRLILHVNRCTPDCMIYGETGRGAILSVVKCRMVSFWSRLVSGKQSKYSYILYNLIKSSKLQNG